MTTTLSSRHTILRVHDWDPARGETYHREEIRNELPDDGQEVITLQDYVFAQDGKAIVPGQTVLVKCANGQVVTEAGAYCCDRCQAWFSRSTEPAKRVVLGTRTAKLRTKTGIKEYAVEVEKLFCPYCWCRYEHPKRILLGIGKGFLFLLGLIFNPLRAMSEEGKSIPEPEIIPENRDAP